MNKFILFSFFLLSGISYSQDLQLAWSAKLGDPAINVGTFPKEVVIDQHNNKFITGMFLGTHDFDPGPGVFELTALSSTSYSTVFVLKLDSLNNFVWANSYGTTGSVIGNHGVVVDSAGNAYTYGYYEGNLFYDPQDAPNDAVSPFWWNSDAYIHKLDENGTFEWIKAWGGNADEGIYQMQLDEQQNFYLTGYFSDSTDADAGPGTHMVYATAGPDMYLAKYDAGFNFLWAKQYGGTGSVLFPTLTLDAADELTLTGNYSGIVDFDMNAGAAEDTAYSFSEDMFTHVMDRDGNHKWHHTIKGAGDQSNGRCVQDSQRNRYVFGSFESTFDFNPDGAPDIIEFQDQPYLYTDSYIMKLDSTGNRIWTKAIQGKGIGEIQGMKMDADQLIVYGSLNAKTDLDPNSGFILVEPPLMINEVLYLEKLDTNANVLWHEEFIGSNILNVMDLEIDHTHNYWLVGQLAGSVDMDPGPGVAELVHNEGMATHLTIFGELPCSPLGTDLSDPINATCSVSGEVSAAGVYGAPPYTYRWLTNPPITGPTLTTDTCGLYFAEVTDNNGCVDTNSVYVDGPVSTGMNLDVNLITGTFVQGQPAMLWLDAYNGGCQPTAGTIQLILDPQTSYDSCSVVPATISGDTLTWDVDFGNSDSTHFMATVFVTTSQTVITGDTVCFIAQVDPFTGDVDTLNNIKAYCEPILASYDPNDKKVFPKGLCDDHVYMGQPLTYTVRFQNTGNSEAIHVNIVDIMDADLDLSTLQVLAQSHPGLSVNHMGGRELQFNFRNIHLPDSLSDPVGSNGYVVFKIAPRAGTAVNTVVSNEVDIFFDFNSPIHTNTVTTTYTNDIPCIHTDDLSFAEMEEASLLVFPNPTRNEVTCYLPDGQPGQLTVYSSFGLLVLTTEIVNGSVLSLKQLPDGIYFFRLDGHKVVRIVKQ